MTKILNKLRLIRQVSGFLGSVPIRGVRERESPMGINLRKIFKSLWADERGQSTTEYILMLAVVVMIALKFKKTFSSQLDGILGKVNTDISSVVDNP